MTGYSLLMALMVATVGVLFLLIARHGGTVPGLLRSTLLLGGVASGVGLVVSIALMPLPPVIAMAVNVIAVTTGLIRDRVRRSASERPRR